MEHRGSFFDRFVVGEHPFRAVIVASVILLCLLLGAITLDDAWGDVFQEGVWRGLLLAPVIIIYILFVSPVMSRMGDAVIRAIRPVIDLEGEHFNKLMDEGSRTSSALEMITFLIGFSLGLLTTLPDIFVNGISWLGLYWVVTSGFMYGLLVLTIYISVASTRLVAVLHRQPMSFDILDLRPFEPIGRQSLMLALVFIGGITISLLLSYQPESISSPQFWIVNLLLVLVTLFIFFLNMRPTHRILVAEKNNRLEPVRRHIINAYREFVQRLDLEAESGEYPAEILALEAYEKRLRNAPTWPYNTAMLRTLFFSVMIPLGTLLVRIVFEIWFR